MTREKTIRVTHVVFDLQGGGLESLIATMARGFAGTAIRTSVITLGGRAGRVGEAIAPLLDQLLVTAPTRGVSMIAPVALVRAIRALRPDVVHLHSGAWFKGALAARLAGVPRVVFTEHGREHHDPALLRFLDRCAARLTDVVVAVSPRLADYMQHRLGVPRAKLRTIENAIDLERFQPGAPPAGLREQLRIPDGALVMGSIGRLEHVKGYDRLLALFAGLRQRLAGRRELYLVIAGDGGERAALEAKAHALGVADAVRLPGWADSPIGFYRLFDLFALTSRSEGLSVSLLEAIACGVPPVVNDVGANGVILGDALASQLVPEDDWARYADVAEATLASAERLAELRRLARVRAEERFGAARLLEAYAEVYAAPA